MSYASHLTPRQETLSEDGIEGIIDLSNLADRRRRKIEARPDAFLSLTYPTAEIRRVIDRLNARFAGHRDTPALFLFEGLKGSGKSHLLVLAYHLLKNPAEAGKWLKSHDLALTSPTNAIIIVHKYTDRPLLKLWDFVFQEAGLRISGTYDVYPSDRQILDSLGDRHLILILDELEQGIRMISDEALRRQNIAFLQMLSELGNRTPQVTILASIYDAGQEPGATLIRVPNVRVQFARSTLADRARVVLHRLFDNYIGFDPNTVAGTVDSLLNVWRRFMPTFDANAFRPRMLECYPFHPELLTLILERTPARGGFQNIRGSIGFLANLVRITHESEDIVTAGHATVRDLATATLLQDLDPSGDLINRAKGNLEELADRPLSEKLAAATMLYTLTGEGRSRGATREELLRHVMLPGADINDFEQTLMAFQKYASHFHAAEGRFFFDLEENADAKVEFRSLTIDPDGSKARAILRTIWTEDIFRETETVVVFTTTDETKTTLESMRNKDRLRVVLGSRRLSADERHDLYHGLSVRNQVLLLEPRASDFDLTGNADLIKWARRHLAAKELAQQTEQAGDRERRDEYDRIGREDRGHIVNAIKRAGLQCIRFEAYGGSPSADRVEPESLSGTSKEDVIRNLTENLFPTMVFQEHILERLVEVKHRSVREVDRLYRETLTFPVPMSAQSVTRAVRQLCVDKRISVQHVRGNFCGRDPQLTDVELMEARIEEPVEAQPPAPAPKEPPPPPPQGLVEIEVAPAGPLALFVGGTHQLTAAGFDAKGKPLGRVEVAWRTSSPSVATVSPAGVVTVVSLGEARITAVAGSVVSNEVVLSATAGPTETISIPFKSSKGLLRQEVASRLAQVEGAQVTSVRFQIFQTEQEVELSNLPGGLRGGLSGQGVISFEITIAKRGELSKAQVEQFCEQLPDFPNAQYMARLEITGASAQG